MNELNVGDIVVLKRAVLDCESGTLGFVFNTYLDYDDSSKKAAQIVFENGDYDGFSYREQQLFLHPQKYPSNIDYKFSNVMILARDCQKGLFNEAWEQTKKQINT